MPGGSRDSSEAGRSTGIVMSPCSTGRTRSPGCSRDALRELGIPYHIAGGLRFYERREIKDVLAYLRLLLESEMTMRPSGEP